MIYALGDVSGAHFNPAVSLAVKLRGGFGWVLGFRVYRVCMILVFFLLISTLLSAFAFTNVVVPTLLRV